MRYWVSEIALKQASWWSAVLCKFVTVDSVVSTICFNSSTSPLEADLILSAKLAYQRALMSAFGMRTLLCACLQWREDSGRERQEEIWLKWPEGVRLWWMGTHCLYVSHELKILFPPLEGFLCAFRQHHFWSGGQRMWFRGESKLPQVVVHCLWFAVLSWLSYPTRACREKVWAHGWHYSRSVYREL